MSYILDALRKSEQRRRQKQRDQAPLRTARIRSQTGLPGSRRIGGLVLSGCMLLAIIILAGGWWWASRDYEVVENNSGTADSEQTRLAIVPALEATHVSIPGTSDDSEIHPGGDPGTPLSGTADSTAAITGTDATHAQPEVPAKSENEIVDLTDLSPELQSRIAAMKFNGHVYSPTPSLRMIMINDGVLREGGAVDTDLVLTEITEHGLIMQSGSTRFAVELF